MNLRKMIGKDSTSKLMGQVLGLGSKIEGGEVRVNFDYLEKQRNPFQCTL